MRDPADTPEHIRSGAGGARACRSSRPGAARAVGRRRRRPRRRHARALALGLAARSSARTPRAASTSPASASIAATIAATPGRSISPDLTRNLDPATIPIMGKVWPRRLCRLQSGDDAAQHDHRARRIAAARRADLRRHRRRARAGDGGRRQELAEDRIASPACAEHAYVTDVFAVAARRRHGLRHASTTTSGATSSRTSLKSADRGRTWTSITGDLPQRSGRVEHRAGSRQRQPAVRGHGVRRLVHRRRRAALDAARRRHSDDAGARPCNPAPRERSGRRRRSGAARSSSTTTRALRELSRRRR